MSQIVPVVEGFTITNGIRRIDIGGRDITEYFMNLIRRSGYLGLHTSAEFQIVRMIKETLCMASKDPLTEESVLKQEDSFKDFLLPDGTALKIGLSIC